MRNYSVRPDTVVVLASTGFASVAYLHFYFTIVCCGVLGNMTDTYTCLHI